MKISTKFLTGAVVSVGFIVAILFGNTVVIQQIRQTTRDKSSQTTETIKIALTAKDALKSEIIALKDMVLFKNEHTDIDTFHIQFIQSLDKLQHLMPDATEFSIIRRRHQFLDQISRQLTKRSSSETYLADSQQYFKAINSFNRDIEFFLNEIIEDANKQSFVVEEQLENLHQVQRIISFIVVGVIVILFIAKFTLIWRPMIKSLQQLQIGTAEIAAGKLDYRLDIRTEDEVEDLAKAFNYMAVKLAQSRETLLKNTQLTQMNQRLELEIFERKQVEEAMRHTETLLRQQTQQLEQTLCELQSTQAQLIQTEKMSSLGQMVAGVAHEINNPVNFIHGNITHASKYTQEILELIRLYQEEIPNPGHKIQEKVEDIDLEFLLEDLPKILSSMTIGSVRIQQIVLSLRSFSRLDEADMKEVDIHEGLDSTLLILQNRLKAKPERSNIEVIKEYGDLPLVECYPGQLNQVFMNIINNAIDALESSDTYTSQITIHTEVSNNNRVVVKIADNGPGISENVKQKLFDPFFTTKPVGQGTGLGLSISYQIVVQKHSGVLRCESELGKGTVFWIEIPLRQEGKQAVSTTNSQNLQKLV